ncbi:hypothetical protein GCM10020254_79480 [Streptomyces goshikiensis]
MAFSLRSGMKAEETTSRSNTFHGSRKKAFGRSACAPRRISISTLKAATQNRSAACSGTAYASESPL